MESELERKVAAALDAVDPLARAVLGAWFEIGRRSREVYAPTEHADDRELAAAYERGLRLLRTMPRQRTAGFDLHFRIPAGTPPLYG